MTASDAATIIAFHALEDGDGPVCMEPHVFSEVVHTFVDDGCTMLRVDEIVARLRAGSALPPRTVALTFDDAYASVHRVALPVLESLGIAATVFPVTSQLGGTNRWDADRGRPPLSVMDSTQLRELVDAGWELGGHSHTHRSLPSISSMEVLEEITRSKAVLEELSKTPVRTFAYPYGDHDGRTRALVDAHYEAGLTIGAGQARRGHPLDRLPRVEAWYLRRPWQVRAVHGRPSGAYLGARRVLRMVGRVWPR